MENYVRRDDLKLRSLYPSLKTKIFEIETEKFLIYVQNPFDDRDSLCEEFNNSIRFITNPVKLTFELPEKFIKEILVIADSEIGDNFAGIGWTVNQFYNLLYSKFPFLKSVVIDSVENGVIKIHFPNDLSGLYNSQLTSFLDTMSGDSIKFEAHFDCSFTGKFDQGDQSERVLTLIPSRWNKKRIEYEEKDEAFWFDKISAVYQGKITKKSILSNRCILNSCYIPYLGFSNVNIRNGLLMFDHVYVDLPLEKKIDVFCKQQQITKDDLIYLVSQGRLSFVTLQPYDRIDSDFLMEVYRINPNAVLSRRLLSILIIADLVEINRNYVFSDEMLSFLKPEDFGDSKHKLLNSRKMYDVATWPRRALRKSLDVLTLNSPMRVSALGINKCFELPNDDHENDALNFEFMANSEYVHIASSLNAFYFPFWGEKYETKIQSSIMYQMLNFFKCSDEKELLASSQRMMTFLKGNYCIPNIDLLEVNTFPSVQEVLRFSQDFCSAKNFNTLFSYLDNFSLEDRNEKILQYNKALKELALKRDYKTKLIELAFSALGDVCGLVIPSTIFEIAKFGVEEVIYRNESFKNLWNEKLSIIKPEHVTDSKNIRFLKQISPVARLKIFNE